jgi:hypothetical protein
MPPIGMMEHRIVINLKVISRFNLDFFGKLINIATLHSRSDKHNKVLNFELDWQTIKIAICRSRNGFSKSKSKWRSIQNNISVIHFAGQTILPWSSTETNQTLSTVESQMPQFVAVDLDLNRHIEPSQPAECVHIRLSRIKEGSDAQ